MSSDYRLILGSRRSIRRYRDEPVPEELIKRLLEAAAWAPSAHDRQPWRFAIVKEASTRERLGHAMGERLLADLAAEGQDAEEAARRAERSRQRVVTAPVLLLVCMTMAGSSCPAGRVRAQREHHMAAQSVAAAIENLLLAASAEGLGACWVGAPLYCPDTVSDALSLPEDWEPQALITLGYPAEWKRPVERPMAAGMVIYR